MLGRLFVLASVALFVGWLVRPEAVAWWWCLPPLSPVVYYTYVGYRARQNAAAALRRIGLP